MCCGFFLVVVGGFCCGDFLMIVGKYRIFLGGSNFGGG